MKLFVKLQILAALLLSTACTFAQGGNGIYFMGGTDMLKNGELNQHLAAASLPQTDRQLISYGLGFHAAASGKVILGFSYHWLSSQEYRGATDSRIVKLSESYWLIDIGYSLINLGNLHMYPLVGAGYGKLTLSIADEQAPTFNEILTLNSGLVRLTTKGMILEGGAGADYKFNTMLLGVRAGYIYDPFPGDWTREDVDVKDGPKEGIMGPYVKILFGFGG